MPRAREDWGRLAIRHRFWIGWAITFAPAAAYTLLVARALGADGAADWVKGDLSFTLFALGVLPTLAGYLALGIDLSPIRAGGLGKNLALLGAFLVLGALLVRGDLLLDHAVESPAYFHDARGARAMERGLREALRPPDEKVFRRGGGEDAPRGSGAAEDPGVVAARAYAAAYPPWRTFAEFRERASAAGWAMLVVNAVAMAFCVTLAWYVLVLARSRVPVALPVREVVTVVYTGTLLWFPARLYSEWFVNFYSLANMRQYNAFVAALALAVVVLIPLLKVLKPRSKVPKFFALVQGVLAAGAGTVAFFDPALLAAAAAWVDGLRWETVAVVVFGLGASIWGLLAPLGPRLLSSEPAVTGHPSPT